MSSSDSKSVAEASLRDSIAEEHAAAIDAAETAVGHAVNCGRYLVQLKEALPHGLFVAYVEENFDFTRQTASGYMRLATAADKGELENASSIRGALKQLAAPRDREADESDGPATDFASKYGEVAARALAELEEIERLKRAERRRLSPKELWDLEDRIGVLVAQFHEALTPFERFWLKHKGLLTPDMLQHVEETCEVAGMRALVERVDIEQYIWVGYLPADSENGDGVLSYHPGWARYCREKIGGEVKFATVDLMPDLNPNSWTGGAA